MRKIYRISGLVILLQIFIIVAISLTCTSKGARAPEAETPKKPETIAPEAKISWEQEWEALIKEAQKEGRLSIYSGLERDTVLAFRKHFGEKYNIDLEIVTGSSSEINPKLFMERQNSLYIPDLYIEGPTSPLLVYKPRGILQSLDKAVFRPDVLNEKDWWHGFGPYFDKDHYLAAGTRTVQPAVIINTKMVSPSELTSYNDLLSPKWKNKIVVGDPTTGGGPQSTMISTLLIMGEDYIKKLAEQAAVITRDQRLVVDWVSRGKYPIGFGGGTSIVSQYIKEGVDVDMISFKEGHGTTASGVVVLFDRAPHPNAAKLFINWFLTREAQQIYSVASGKMSRRLDVSEDHLLPAQRMKEGVKYLVNDEEYYEKMKSPQYFEILNKYYLNQ